LSNLDEERGLDLAAECLGASTVLEVGARLYVKALGLINRITEY